MKPPISALGLGGRGCGREIKVESIPLTASTPGEVLCPAVFPVKPSTSRRRVLGTVQSGLGWRTASECGC
ncbi:hypothetical protein scyTo_0022738 [Scyliorhinus torazame]|uniref:Uncharacterized protein n=1 Tax=Scyliorhinus torazame TaxID=75743 RepID=A0A401Q6I5_SCYTO|nr:hypothetical protein [Scyliorhinus torazame]